MSFRQTATVGTSGGFLSENLCKSQLGSPFFRWFPTGESKNKATYALHNAAGMSLPNLCPPPPQSPLSPPPPQSPPCLTSGGFSGSFFLLSAGLLWGDGPKTTNSFRPTFRCMDISKLPFRSCIRMVHSSPITSRAFWSAGTRVPMVFSEEASRFFGWAL